MSRLFESSFCRDENGDERRLAAPLARGRNRYVRRDAVPYPIYSYRGRTADLSRPVEVYRNLRGFRLPGPGPWYSIRQGGRVVGHAKAMMLQDAEFVVQEVGRQRVLRTGRKNVHAFIRGALVGSGCGTAHDREQSLGARIGYNPYAGGTFFIEGAVRHPICGAMSVKITEEGISAAYTH